MKGWRSRRAEREDAWLRMLPVVEKGHRIPRHLIQVYLFGEPGEEIGRSIARSIAANPNWRHSLFDDADIVAFIRRYYGEAVLARYHAIDPRYGAARVDLFRYLYIYRCGGAYLDVKSGFGVGLSEAIGGAEQYILSQWRNGPGQFHQGIGLHPDLEHVAGGEFQMFHVIGVAGHPFLRAVIARVLANIDEYSPWRFGIGRIGVLRVTGPIAFTLAIHPLLTTHEHKRIANETEIDLSPSIHQGGNPIKRPHYSTLNGPVVKMTGAKKLSFWAFYVAYLVKQAMAAATGRR